MSSSDLKRILLIEDNIDIQKITEVSLCHIGGYTVEISSSGADGLIKAESFDPQLILLDVMMPEMNGITTLLKLRENPKIAHIPVIFLTAKVQPNELEEYVELGALGVITKPFDPMTLPTTIQNIWNHIVKG